MRPVPGVLQATGSASPAREPQPAEHDHRREQHRFPFAASIVAVVSGEEQEEKDATVDREEERDGSQ